MPEIPGNLKQRDNRTPHPEWQGLETSTGDSQEEESCDGISDVYERSRITLSEFLQGVVYGQVPFRCVDQGRNGCFNGGRVCESKGLYKCQALEECKE